MPNTPAYNSLASYILILSTFSTNLNNAYGVADPADIDPLVTAIGAAETLLTSLLTCQNAFCLNALSDPTAFTSITTLQSLEKTSDDIVGASATLNAYITALSDLMSTEIWLALGPLVNWYTGYYNTGSTLPATSDIPTIQGIIAPVTAQTTLLSTDFAAKGSDLIAFYSDVTSFINTLDAVQGDAVTLATLASPSSGSQSTLFAFYETVGGYSTELAQLASYTTIVQGFITLGNSLAKSIKLAKAQIYATAGYSATLLALSTSLAAAAAKYLNTTDFSGSGVWTPGSFTCPFAD